MKLFLALLTLIGLGLSAFAPAPVDAQQWFPGGQGSPVVCAYNSSPPTISSGKFIYAQCNTNGELITSGGGGGSSASPFLTSGAYVNVPSVTTSVANSALPTGSPPSIGVWNYGSNPVAIKLSASGTASGTFATADAIIGSGSCQQLATTGFTNINYLTSTSTSSLQIVGATSGAIIGCGGGSSSGASGNVFQATAFTEGTASSATTTQVFALSGSTTIYLVNYAYQTDAAATGNGTFQIVTGTGTNCATINKTLTPVWNFAANAGIQEGSIGVLGASSAGDEMCVVTTAAQKVNWRIGIVQQ